MQRRAATILGFMVSLILCFWFIAGDLPAGETKDLVAEAQQIRNEAKPFKIELWTEDGKAAYNVDDRVEFLFRADRDCYVTLFDIGTSGAITKLFPNKWNGSNRIEKGKTYRIPPADGGFVFRVNGPEGLEYVKAVATLDPLHSVEKAELVPKGDFQEFKKPEALIKDLSLELKQQDTKKWTETEVSFKIAKAGEPAGPVGPVSTGDPFMIKLWTDKTEYKEGDAILFSFQSEKDCDLTLIDIGTSGNVRIIFPNQYSRNNFIRANQVYNIPPEGLDASFAYKVFGPAGKNTIKAIGTTRHAQLYSNDLPFKSQVYPEWGPKQKVLRDIESELAKMEPKTFSETEVTVEIKQ